MTGKEEMDVVLLHIVLNPLGSVHLGREVGEYQQVGRAESITTESIMFSLVKERRASSGMTGRKDDLYLTAAKVYYLTVVKILDLPLVVTHIVRNDGHVTCIQINLRERPYATHMVAMGMGRYHSDGLGSNLCHNLVEPWYVCSCINQDCTVITLNEVEPLP